MSKVIDDIFCKMFFLRRKIYWNWHPSILQTFIAVVQILKFARNLFFAKAENLKRLLLGFRYFRIFFRYKC